MLDTCRRARSDRRSHDDFVDTGRDTHDMKRDVRNVIPVTAVTVGADSP